jgi:hypothetical protein
MNLVTVLLLTFKPVMKNLVLIIFLFGSLALQAQEKEKPSLKNLLFSGKLKKDSTGVIRSTDDLSTKIDTSTKKEVAPVATNQPAPNVQQDKNATVSKDGTTTTASGIAAGTLTTNTDSAAAVAPAATTAPAKTNTKLWKEYNDNLVKTLNDEVLKAKQIKKNTYYLMVDYEIAPDGQVTFTNLTSTPENAFLTAQVRQIMDSTPLRLNPITDSSNQGKKVKRKQQIVVTKE